jgi:hypothetical protein
VQIKSHAQKVLKRMDNGEDVFQRLVENEAVIESLLLQAAQDREAKALANSTASTSRTGKRKYKKPKAASAKTSSSARSSETTGSFTVQNVQHEEPVATVTSNREAETVEDPKDSVIAAAALCQLSSLGSACWGQ